jgi:hypothetical protein
MFDAAAPGLDEGRQSYADWATKPRRGQGLARRAAAAIIRVRPVLLVNLALMFCVAIGLAMFALATFALTPKT